MRVFGNRTEWDATDEESVVAALTTQDEYGGGEFWLAQHAGDYPCLVIQTSAGFANIHYFPADRHPGFRYVSPSALDADGSTLFRYVGCDPEAGIDVPNEFVTGVDEAVTVALQFLRNPAELPGGEWFEL